MTIQNFIEYVNNTGLSDFREDGSMPKNVIDVINKYKNKALDLQQKIVNTVKVLDCSVMNANSFYTKDEINFIYHNSNTTTESGMFFLILYYAYVICLKTTLGFLHQEIGLDAIIPTSWEEIENTSLNDIDNLLSDIDYAYGERI